MIAGILMILFGLFMIGIFQPKFLVRERRMQFRKPAGYLGLFSLVSVLQLAGRRVSGRSLQALSPWRRRHPVNGLR